MSLGEKDHYKRCIEICIVLDLILKGMVSKQIKKDLFSYFLNVVEKNWFKNIIRAQQYFYQKDKAKFNHGKFPVVT